MVRAIVAAGLHGKSGRVAHGVASGQHAEGGRTLGAGVVSIMPRAASDAHPVSPASHTAHIALAHAAHTAPVVGVVGLNFGAHPVKTRPKGLAGGEGHVEVGKAGDHVGWTGAHCVGRGAQLREPVVVQSERVVVLEVRVRGCGHCGCGCAALGHASLACVTVLWLPRFVAPASHGGSSGCQSGRRMHSLKCPDSTVS